MYMYMYMYMYMHFLLFYHVQFVTCMEAEGNRHRISMHMCTCMYMCINGKVSSCTFERLWDATCIWVDFVNHANTQPRPVWLLYKLCIIIHVCFEIYMYIYCVHCSVYWQRVCLSDPVTLGAINK